MTPSPEFAATRAEVEDQGRPSLNFLIELTDWAKTAPDSIFAPNTEPHDVMPRLLPFLASPSSSESSASRFKWDSLLHRKCALLELMRVHAGFESGWRANEGVDKSNPRSLAHPEQAEAGWFQISFDSQNLDKEGRLTFLAQKYCGVPLTIKNFRETLKTDSDFCFEYYARLVRIDYRWAGPLVRTEGDSVYQWLSRPAMKEFEALLT